jgi:hypothetical protein
MEEDAWFTPGQTLDDQRKHVAGEGMEGMRDGKDNVAIHAIGYS